jgi:Leucine-rich repeat (LRR) protein
MFIKKDLRKIPEILADSAKRGKENSNDNKPLQDLQLQRRKAEFPGGSIRALCQPSNAPALRHLESLSLYDCNISDLCGIGMLSNLTSLSCGRNPNITTIPEEFSDLEALQELCLDDCALGPVFPEPLLQLQNLHELRLSNNKIEALPENFGHRLYKLRMLGLDHNLLTSLPDSLENLVHLTTLLLRHNQLASLPRRFPGSSVSDSLQLLHISSNQLTTLPDCLVDCSSLTHIYANGNALVTLPLGLGELLYNLKHLNLAHNQLNDNDENNENDSNECRQRLADLYDIFGKPDTDGNCVDKTGVKVLLRGNPALIVVKNKLKDKKMNKDKRMNSPTSTKMDDDENLELHDDKDDVEERDNDADDDDELMNAAPTIAALDMDIS